MSEAGHRFRKILAAPGITVQFAYTTSFDDPAQGGHRPGNGDDLH